VSAAPNQALLEVYQGRADLQKVFDAKQFLPIPKTIGERYLGLEDWAEQDGWKEYESLSDYAPTCEEIPLRAASRKAEPNVTAKAYLVMDTASGQILISKNSDQKRAIASLTKLMTADVVLACGVLKTRIQDVRNGDDVGGAKLYVASGETFTVEDLMYAALVGSANNAANALARSTDLSRPAFVGRMNDLAKELGLSKTTFVDPSGIDPANVSTARELAALAQYVFSKQEIREYTKTKRQIVSALKSRTKKEMINTNWILRLPEYEGVSVTASKTGYLVEAGWNVVTALLPDDAEKGKELLVVVLGATSRAGSFKDTHALAEWAWQNTRWEKRQ